MNSKEQLTENIKIRVSYLEKQALKETAQKESLSISAIIRSCTFSKDITTTYAVKVQRSKIKNELRNRIQFLDISQKAKEKVIKELNQIDN